MEGGTQLTEVRAAHRFDEAALHAYLNRHLEGYRGGLRVLQFEGGQSNPTFLLDAGDERYVMRKKPPGKLLPSAHAVDREFRVLSALAKSPVPVPRTRIFCDDPEIIGTAFYLMEYVEGRISRDLTLPEETPAARSAIYDHMNEVMAALHQVDFDAAGLGDFGKRGGYITRQVALWTKQYEAAKTDEIPAMDRLIEVLPERIPSDDTTAIAHGDFRLENMVLHPSEPRIVAVLDWELCTLGHPYADLAYNCMPYVLAPGEENSLSGVDLDAAGIPRLEDYVRAYGRRTGREEIPDWPFYQVFSIFRLAAIAQGVYKRGLQGNASSEEALERGAKARMLASRAWELAEERLGV